MWPKSYSGRQQWMLLVIVLLVGELVQLASNEPQLYNCINWECDEWISKGKSLIRYMGKTDKHLSFKANEDILIVSKPVDPNASDWVAKIGNKIGLVPKGMVREDKVNKNALRFKVDLQEILQFGRQEEGLEQHDDEADAEAEYVESEEDKEGLEEEEEEKGGIEIEDIGETDKVLEEIEAPPPPPPTTIAESVVQSITTATTVMQQHTEQQSIDPTVTEAMPPPVSASSTVSMEGVHDGEATTTPSPGDQSSLESILMSLEESSLPLPPPSPPDQEEEIAASQAADIFSSINILQPSTDNLVQQSATSPIEYLPETPKTLAGDKSMEDLQTPRIPETVVLDTIQSIQSSTASPHQQQQFTTDIPAGMFMASKVEKPVEVTSEEEKTQFSIYVEEKTPEHPESTVTTTTSTPPVIQELPSENEIVEKAEAGDAVEEVSPQKVDMVNPEKVADSSPIIAAESLTEQAAESEPEQPVSVEVDDESGEYLSTTEQPEEEQSSEDVFATTEEPGVVQKEEEKEQAEEQKAVEDEVVESNSTTTVPAPPDLLPPTPTPPDSPEELPEQEQIETGEFVKSPEQEQIETGESVKSPEQEEGIPVQNDSVSSTDIPSPELEKESPQENLTTEPEVVTEKAPKLDESITQSSLEIEMATPPPVTVQQNDSPPVMKLVVEEEAPLEYVEPQPEQEEPQVSSEQSQTESPPEGPVTEASVEITQDDESPLAIDANSSTESPSEEEGHSHSQEDTSSDHQHDEHSHSHHHHHHHRHHNHDHWRKDSNESSSFVLVIKHLSSTLLSFLPEPLQDTILDVDDALVFTGIIALTLVSICVPYFLIEGYMSLRPLKKKVVELNKSLWKVSAAYETQQEEFEIFKQKALSHDEFRRRCEQSDNDVVILKKLETKHREQITHLRTQLKSQIKEAVDIRALIEKALQDKKSVGEELARYKSAYEVAKESLQKSKEELQNFHAQSKSTALQLGVSSKNQGVLTSKISLLEQETEDMKIQLQAENEKRKIVDKEREEMEQGKMQVEKELGELKKICGKYEETVGNLTDEIGRLESELESIKETLGEDSPLLEVAEIQAKAQFSEKECESLRIRLDGLTADNDNLTGKLGKTEEVLEEVRGERDEVNKRLQVLEGYFKEREEEYIKTIEQLQLKESVRDKGKEELIRMIEEKDRECKELAERLEQLKEEFDETKHQHRNEIRAQEGKSHENWLSLCQAERKAQDARKEAELLRQRLTQLSKEMRDEDEGDGLNGEMGSLFPVIPHELVPLPILEDEPPPSYFGLEDFVPPPPLPEGDDDGDDEHHAQHSHRRPPPLGGRLSPSSLSDDMDDNILSPIGRLGRREDEYTDGSSGPDSPRRSPPPPHHIRGGWASSNAHHHHQPQGRESNNTSGMSMRSRGLPRATSSPIHQPGANL